MRSSGKQKKTKYFANKLRRLRVNAVSDVRSTMKKERKVDRGRRTREGGSIAGGREKERLTPVM